MAPSLREGLASKLYTEGSTGFQKCLLTRQLHIHSHHLVLMVDIDSCLQQSLDCLGVSLPSSNLQRNTAILFESRVTREQSLTLGMHVQQGLLCIVCECLSICLCVYIYFHATGNKADGEGHQ